MGYQELMKRASIISTIYYQHEHTTKKISVKNGWLSQRSNLIGLVSEDEEQWIPKERVCRIEIKGK